MVLAIKHGAHCDADLRDAGCVCDDTAGISPRSGTDAVARVMNTLADDMDARERDALARRDYREAAAYNNRRDAYRHAAQVAQNISDPFRARVETALVSRYRRIVSDQANGVSGGDDLARKRLLIDLLDEVGLWPYAEKTPW